MPILRKLVKYLGLLSNLINLYGNFVPSVLKYFQWLNNNKSVFMLAAIYRPRYLRLWIFYKADICITVMGV